MLPVAERAAAQNRRYELADIFRNYGEQYRQKCLAKARWLEKQKLELLPVGYFDLVFTVPHELNRLILVNKKPLINILFHAVSETLLEFARTHFGGTLGLTAVL